jgi:hypothetical protein
LLVTTLLHAGVIWAGLDPRHVQENPGQSSMDTTLIYNENDDSERHPDTQKFSNDNSDD